MARASAPEGSEEPPQRPSGCRGRSRLTADYLEAVGHQMGEGSLTAGALARAAAEVLPVDGAGISTTTGELRLPLGASTAAAERAEELQTTLGDGPCLVAARTRVPYVGDFEELRERWPLYTEELTRRTPYRSTAAIPLLTPDGQVFAALDLFSESPGLAGRLDVDEVTAEIGAALGALLDLCLRPVREAAADDALPEWYADATARRLDVWVAVGIVMGRLRQAGGDALSLLRGYAYSHDRSLDDVAEDIVLGRLEVQHLGD